MKTKTLGQQTGSAHVVIIAILFLLLCATLGVVFYQNFIASRSDNKNQAPTASAPAVTTKTAQVAFASSIYELDYPKDWTVATTKLDQSTMGGSTTTITNPAKTVQATFTVSEIAPDETCDSSDGLKISDYNVASRLVEKLTDMPLYLVETMSDSTGGGYQYKIGLTQDGGDTHSAVGDSHCNVMHVGQASSALMAAGQLAKPTILATIDFPNLPTPPQPAAKDMQDIKGLLGTADYSGAVKILESVRKKE